MDFFAPPEYDLPLLQAAPTATYFEYSKKFTGKKPRSTGPTLIIPKEAASKTTDQLTKEDPKSGGVGIESALLDNDVSYGKQITKTIYDKLTSPQQKFLELQHNIVVGKGKTRMVATFEQEDTEKSYELDEELKERYNAVMKYCNELKSNGF